MTTGVSLSHTRTEPLGPPERLHTEAILVNVRVPRGLAAAFVEQCAIDGQTRSSAVRRLIRSYVAGDTPLNEERRPGRDGAQELTDMDSTTAERPRCST